MTHMMANIFYWKGDAVDFASVNITIRVMLSIFVLNYCAWFDKQNYGNLVCAYFPNTIAANMLKREKYVFLLGAIVCFDKNLGVEASSMSKLAR